MRRARIAAGAATVAALLAFATGSSAGTYEVRACDGAPGAANNSWVAFNGSPTHYEQAQTCPSGGGQYNGLRTFDVLMSGGAPAQSQAHWSFTAPSGTQIASATLKRWIGKDTAQSWQPFVRADGNVVETCTIPGGEFNCQVGVSGGSTQSYAGLNVQTLAVGAFCTQMGPNTCSTGFSIHQVWAVVYDATVTVSDPTGPTLALDEPASTLLTESGWSQGGPRQVRVDAGDAQSGVRELRVIGAAQVRASDLIPAAQGGCGEPGQGVAYTYAQPCADGRGVGGPRTVQLDTSSWPSGEHADVRVEAVDAGSEVVSSQAFVVRIDRDRPTVALSAPDRVAAGAPIRASASGQDAHSGLDRVEIEISRNGRPFVSYDPNAPPSAIGGSAYRLRARAVDRVGLASEFATARTEAGRKAASRLRSVRAKRRGASLIVTGRLAAAATGRVKIGVKARVFGRLRRARRAAVVKSGRFRARVRLGRALRRAHAGVLTVSYGGDARHGRGRVVKRLRLRR